MKSKCSILAGEKLTKEETKALMKELCDPADDDGFMPFKRELHFIHLSPLSIRELAPATIECFLPRY